ncbi:hypothetical protein [Sphingosinicella sp. CPCC 101087]|uniref:hypothetical protein n=1 Tax=Sphingosinicella sp. CPCC 101087 TaxID=2497754 RepID=UPI00101CC2DB|nr:hypothetical protein [Sphingosinicella sp. CPCC 101087]
MLAQMRLALTAALALLLAACGSREEAADSTPQVTENGAPSSSLPAAPDAGQSPAQRWDLQSSGEGVALAFSYLDGRATIRLFCPTGENRLLVNVPAFRPIGSEERLSFGGGGEVVALVADTGGDARRGGVSAAGAVPANLVALVGGPLSASYGAQTTGPHPAPPQILSRAFVAACGEGAAEAVVPGPPADSPSACLMQGGERLDAALRAVGTEPFWAARIEGRCITYSHPEDQDGTRVWTRYAERPDGATWTGALGGRPFVLSTRAAPRCSDGMSDSRYPIAVELMVNGEQRRGCAKPV